MIKSLSVVIPFYNESVRINKTLIEIKNFINKNKKIKIEIILINDGSTDKSLELIKTFLNKNRSLKSKVKTVNLKINIGKGGALKKGVLTSKSEWILTSDMDLSVSLFEINSWMKKGLLNFNSSIFFGSRELNDSKVITKFYRKFLGIFFRIFSNLLLDIKLRDTQCGFKLYKKKTAKKIFSNLTCNGFEHDLEIVLLAKKSNLDIIELPVYWTHMPGSKLNIFLDPIKMLIGIIQIRFLYIK
tara:strand:+ start:1661 stop:2389 length:729 start_codon:yes stop_codon:yes gene_type:complete